MSRKHENKLQRTNIKKNTHWKEEKTCGIPLVADQIDLNFSNNIPVTKSELKLLAITLLGRPTLNKLRKTKSLHNISVQKFIPYVENSYIVYYKSRNCNFNTKMEITQYIKDTITVTHNRTTSDKKRSIQFPGEASF